VLALLRSCGTPLDDDEIAAATGLNRHYVNPLCWGLLAAGLISRTKGHAGKLVRAALNPGEVAGPPPAVSRRGRPQRGLVNRANVEELFADNVAAFEASEASFLTSSGNLP
jgi:hypothetical protein